jgi:2-oxoglutarate ferredoxin oxidoreductase subunit beta
LKIANQKMVVIAEGGDGDAYDEGMCHFINGCKRNMDITYLVHNNGVFGLTTGQVSPTGAKGFVSSTTPYGSEEPPINPIALAIVSGATFVARGFSGDVDHLADLISTGIKHKGFSHIDIFQVCVTFNPSKSYQWYQEKVYKLDTSEHDPSNKLKAIELALKTEDRLPIGIFYRVEEPTYEDQLPQLKQGPLVEQAISNINISGLMEEAI